MALSPLIILIYLSLVYAVQRSILFASDWFEEGKRLMNNDTAEWLQVSIIIVNKTPYTFKLEDRWNSRGQKWGGDSDGSESSVEAEDDIALSIVSGQTVRAKVMLSVPKLEINVTDYAAVSDGMRYSISDKSDG